jgi:hemoglobin-like flavoprotein
MTPEAIALVRSSVALIRPGPAALGPCFYDQLFALAPGARGLFPADLEEQAGKLVDMLGCIVAALDQPDELGRLFAAMGRRHVGYGAKEGHYDAVGAALLRALHQTLGPHWTPELGDAWAEVYGEMAEAMVAAARQDDGSPPDPAPDRGTGGLGPPDGPCPAGRMRA